MNGGSDDMRATILREATRLFARRGYEGTTVQAVADAVGIRKPSLLYHFGSKEQLHRQVIDDLLAHWRRTIPQILEQTRGAHDRLSATISAVVQFFVEDDARARLMLRELLDHPRAARELIREHLTPWATLLTDYIRMGQQLGLVRPEVQPEAFVIQVVLMVLGTVAIGPVTTAIYDADAPLQPAVDELVRIARDALFVPETHPGNRNGSNPAPAKSGTGA